jgi:hypothetical protein
VVFKGAGFDFDAQPVETLLRPRRPPLHHIQLLPAVATSGNRALARLLRENSRSDSFKPEFPSAGIRCDARARSSASKRTRREQVSRSLRKKRKRLPEGQLRLKFAEAQTEERHFWQRRFYDFNVWSEKKFKEKLKYMHANPAKRGLVLHPKDWPWSSWGHYARGEKGLIRVDCLGDRVAEKQDLNAGNKKRQNPHP